MNVKMVDGPTDAFQAIHVEVLRVEISADGSGWVTLGAPNRVIDLLQLRGGVAETLAAGATLAAGHYGQMRLILGSHNTVTLNDGSVENLTVPSGLQSGIKLTVSFDVAAGTTKDVFIDFDAANSIHMNGTGNGRYILRPTVRAFDLAVTGSISGKLSDSLTGGGLSAVAVTAQTVDASGNPSIVRRTSTAVDGTYTLDLLPTGGTYYVVSQPVVGSVAYDAKASAGISITAAAPTATYDASFTLNASLGGVSGAVTPVAGPSEADTIELTQSLATGFSSHVLIVRDTTADVVASTESYAFAQVPVGLYSLRGVRVTEDAQGNALLSTAIAGAAVSVLAGITVRADLSF
jgi:hypothetical protein